MKFIKTFFFLLIVAVSFTRHMALAAPICQNIFSYNAQVAALVGDDPFKQWLVWEQQFNFAAFRKSGDPVLIPISHISASTVNITYLDSAPKSLRSLISDNDFVRWFKHPFNKNSTLPHFDDPSEESLVAYLTASRSMAFTLGDHIFTLKMATNYPHGPNGARSREKATTKEDVMDGINRMSYIERVDKEIGQDPELILAKEVAIVVDKATGEGYLVRDLSFMNDGNYYLPALSIPYIGRKIAELNRMSPEAFWAKHYAALLGKSKAKLLLRYGLQMETPNPQNIFIQLDSNLRPTGVLVFRDLSDTILIEGVAKGLGEEETLKKDADVGVENGHKIRPYWPNSAWGFSEGGNSFSQLTLDRWRIIHDNAYKQEIEQTLGVDLSQFANIDDNIKFNLLMRSEVFQKKLGEYREELKKKERARHARGEAS